MSYIQTLSGKHFNYLDIHQDDMPFGCSNSLTMMFNQLLNRARQGTAQ